MSDVSPIALRALVAEAVRDAVADLQLAAPQRTGAAVSPPLGTSAGSQLGNQLGSKFGSQLGGRFGDHAGSPAGSASGRAAGADPGPRQRVQSVRIASDHDLQAFTRQLLALFENPKTRQDVRNGWLQFRLDAAPTGPRAPARAVRIERGAVTERRVAEAAEAGQSLVLARGAVLTPLARDRARALGVQIEKER